MAIGNVMWRFDIIMLKWHDLNAETVEGEQANESKPSNNHIIWSALQVL